MHATNRAVARTARNAMKPGPLPGLPPASRSNCPHLRHGIDFANAYRRGGPATCKKVANDRDQGSAEEQNANALGAMTLGSGASGSMAFAGEGGTSPRLLREATARR